MTRLKLLFAATVLSAAIAVAPAASAQTIHYLGAGSSAMFQGFEVAAVNDLAHAIATANPGYTVHHWSIKTSHAAGCAGHCVAGYDNRAYLGSTPPKEYGNWWVTWVCSTNTNPCTGTVTDIWAYLSVDSTVGVRLFLAQASTTQHSAFLQLNTAGGIASTTADNVVDPNLLSDGAPGNGSAATCPTGRAAQCDDSFIDPAVTAALGGATGIPLTAGMTDIRPEDAKYATNRALSTTVDTSVACASKPCRDWALGYGHAPGNTIIGQSIQSGVTGSTATATPVQFALPGYKDPITSILVPKTVKVIPVGETPIMFVTNRTNTTTGLGQACTAAACGAAPWASSYYVSNVWDQHPCTGGPPCNSGALPPAPTTRRPLGNLFTGHDCGTDNAAFQPVDNGVRSSSGGVTPPGGGPPSGAITVWLREPLSGTMNTTEMSEFRRFGTQNGNGAPANGLPAVTSQEQDVNPNAGDNPLKNQPCITFGGVRSRGIGTGEVVGSTGAGGVFNVADSIAYTFFSFGNVSKLATSKNYGYLMIDGIDPLFDSYGNSEGNAGQPAVNTDGTTWGEIPACSSTGVPVDCKANTVWTYADPICGGSTGCTYPHLRDGTYPAWSEVRLLCDTANAHCLAPDHGGSDAYGAEALVENMQADIHNNHVGGVPDLLPFSEAVSGPLSFNPPFGDVNYVREHYSFLLSSQGTTHSIHESNPQVFFLAEGCEQSGDVTPGTPHTGPTPDDECGGDAGGWIVPAGMTATGIQQ